MPPLSFPGGGADGRAGYVTMAFLMDGAARGPRTVATAGARGGSGAPSLVPSGNRGSSSSSSPSSLLPALLLPSGLWGQERFSWSGLLTAALIGANCAAFAYVARRAFSHWHAEKQAQEKQRMEQKEVTRAALAYLQRLWEVAMQADPGPPLDLGAPDANGVFSYEGADGTKLYFRVAPREKGADAAFRSSGGGSSSSGGGLQWEWSTSGRLWQPTSAADSIWYECGEGRSPGLGGRLLIRRLELEGQLVAAARARLGRAASEPFGALPPLDLPGLSPAAVAVSGDGVAVVKPCTPAAVAAAAAAVDAGCGDSESDGGLGLLHPADVALAADAPDSFMCPLSGRIMTDPVVTPGGVTYDRSAVADWIRRHGTDPVTGHTIDDTELYPNLAIRDQICGYFLVRDCINNSH